MKDSKGKLHNGLWNSHKEVKQPQSPSANCKYIKGSNVDAMDKSMKKMAEYTKKNQASY